MIQFIKGTKQQYNQDSYAEAIYQCTDTNETYIFGQKANDIINLSNTSTDLNTLVLDKQEIVYYAYAKGSSAVITNTPERANGSFLLKVYKISPITTHQDMYVSWTDGSVGQFRRYYRDGVWSEWKELLDLASRIESTKGNNPLNPLDFKSRGLNIGYSSIYKTYLGDIGENDEYLHYGFIFNPGSVVNLHLTGTANTTVYTVVGHTSVGHWFSYNKLSDFFIKGRRILNYDTQAQCRVVSYNADTREITVDQTINPDEDWNDKSVGFFNFTDNGTIIGHGSVSLNESLTGSESLAGSTSTDCNIAFGDRCAAIGGVAAAFNWQTIAQNFGETALGISNKSHKGSDSDQQTLFSIGNGDMYCREESEYTQKNALEVMRNGDVYVQGVGNYDGINNDFSAQTLQEVIGQALNSQQEISNISTALENHKNNQDKKHIPDGGHEGQILSWESEGTAKWEDLTNVFPGLEEILAYGVQWNTTVSDPHLTRIGNMSLHKTLPIQSQLKGCIAQGNKVQYWLDENDWKWRKNPVIQNMTLAVADGVYTIVDTLFADNRYKDQWLRINNIPCKVTAIDTGSTTATLTPDEAIEAGAYDVELGAVLNGYDGTVRVYCPNFYIKSYIDGNIRKVYISTVKIDNSWTYQHEVLVDAYRCTVLNTVPENMGYLSTLPVNSAISVVNTESYCRGGGNRSANDTYLETDPFRTDLGKPRTSTSRANMRTYARNTTSELLSYEQYKNIFYWLWVIEYANFNSQAQFNDTLTSEGYKQGGMGSGVTNINGNYWNYYNGYYPLTPCGYGNQLGNRTGLIDMQITTPTTSGGDPTQVYNFKVPRWRGFDNPFGDIWTNLDGIIIDTPLTGASDTGVLPTCYIITDPANYTDTLEGIEEKADRIYSQPHSEGYIKEWHLGSAADMIPQSTGGNTTQFKCDYYWVNYDDTPETLLVGGRAVHGSGAGLGGFGSYYPVSYAYTFVGFRSASAFLSAEQQD